MAEKGVTPRSEDYSRWYTDVVQKAELADYSPVKRRLDILPQRVAVGLDDHAAAHRRIVGHIGAQHYIGIPFRIVFAARSDTLIGHEGGSSLRVLSTSQKDVYQKYRADCNSLAEFC